MKVLIACEFSGIVRQAFSRRGHDAWSCDLLETEIPGNHIVGDVLNILHDNWDLMIAFPPCTHLSVSGARWWKGKRKEQEEALCFFKTLLLAPIPKIAVENPVGLVNSRIRKPDQIIQPYMFGEDASKKTCLWLKNLNCLVPTRKIYKKIYSNQTSSGQNKIGPSRDRWKERSRTYNGIAEAMANQWGDPNRKYPKYSFGHIGGF